MTSEELAAIEMDRAREGLLRAIEGLDLCLQANREYTEVARLILCSETDILGSVFGWMNSTGHGWPQHYGPYPGSLIHRLEFANHFISFHLVDDGDPGIWPFITDFGRSGKIPKGLPAIRPARSKKEYPVIVPYREKVWRDVIGEYEKREGRPMEEADSDKLWRESIISDTAQVTAVFAFYENEDREHRKRYKGHRNEAKYEEVDTDTMALRSWWENR